MQSVTFAVKCPRDIARVYEMTIYLAKLDDGRVVPALGNGCENSNESSECNYCIKSIFEKTLKEPDLSSYPKPVVP